MQQNSHAHSSARPISPIIRDTYTSDCERRPKKRLVVVVVVVDIGGIGCVCSRVGAGPAPVINAGDASSDECPPPVTVCSQRRKTKKKNNERNQKEKEKMHT
jgi:hypothetical protein